LSAFEWGPDLPRLGEGRVELRGLAAADAPAIFEIFGDPEVMRFWSAPPLIGVAAAADMIARVQAAFRERRYFQWGIVARETGERPGEKIHGTTGGAPGELLGTCTLYELERPHRRSGIGLALRRSAWGRGIGREALELLIGFAFRTLDLHRLEADIDPHNERSLRLFERQGFRREGYLRERWHHLGEIQDAVYLGLLRREWPGEAARLRAE
jgi:[ribosomal protein S5]-alanine N-acetyltransferase